MSHAYSEITLRRVEGFRMARYPVISPEPEADAAAHMEQWARTSGLLELPGYTPRRIGWNFPFVSEEQEKKLGLRGYVAAYVVPQDFEPACCGAEMAQQAASDYAVLTITDPFASPFESIPGAYQAIFSYLQAHGYALPAYEGRGCFEFEEVYQWDGVTYMDIYVPVERSR